MDVYTCRVAGCRERTIFATANEVAGMQFMSEPSSNALNFRHGIVAPIDTDTTFGSSERYFNWSWYELRGKGV